MSLDLVYTVRFDNVTIAAVQDIFNLKASANKGLEVRQISLSAGAVTSPAEIRLNLKRHPVTVTQGSGGTTPTAQKVDSRNPVAATATPHANDTSQGTTSGTAVILESWQWNVLLPFDYMPGPTDSDRDSCDVSEALILEVVATPASTVVSGFFKWAEK